MCGPNLEREDLAEAFQKHLQEGRGLHFGEFLNTTCKHLVRGQRGQGLVWAGPSGRGITGLLPPIDAPLSGPAGPPGEHQPVLLQEQLGRRAGRGPHAHG